MVFALLLGVGWGAGDLSTGLVWVVGCGIGFALVQFRFGFTEPIRRLVTRGDASGVYRIAMLMIILVLGTAILLALPEPFALSLKLSRAPLRWSLVGGAFVFGVGMQMAGRCGSGTLASAGARNGGFAWILAGLIAGVFAGSLQRPLIEAVTPEGLPPLVLTDAVPLWMAVGIQLGVLALLLGLGVASWPETPNEAPRSQNPWPGGWALPCYWVLGCF
ncbi:YeeE/YedE thiosulfate transporter family protein [Synechococcus sp. GFB01]|uniref:YeeE/YedE thiosulfate transporter family protein n=1 Tax=Synechococcus sp. GFB01 TaxID=1662190 RepID=UPI0013791886|nr:YeeE/YedE thiosulfate transporter family protein [Synechococcus sp. GFB01]